MNPVRWVYDLATGHRTNGHWYAYYSIPVFIGFAITYGLIQVGVRAFPDFHFDARGYHIHHYTYGIVILLLAGYIAIWTQSLRVKFACALAYGVAAAFIIDEAFMWFTLTNVLKYQDYDLAFYVGAIFLSFAIAPLFIGGNRTGPPST